MRPSFATNSIASDGDQLDPARRKLVEP